MANNIFKVKIITTYKIIKNESILQEMASLLLSF